MFKEKRGTQEDVWFNEQGMPPERKFPQGGLILTTWGCASNAQYRVFSHFAPIEVWPPQPGFDPTTLCLAAQRHSH